MSVFYSMNLYRLNIEMYPTVYDHIFVSFNGFVKKKLTFHILQALKQVQVPYHKLGSDHYFWLKID